MMDRQWIDKATKVRTGEELDPSALQAHLNALGYACKDLNIRQFANGYSNLTYLISCDNQQYVLRKPPIGANIKSGHDMHREYQILSALSGSYAKVPKPVLYTSDTSIIGSEFYMMEKVEGIILRSQMPREMIPSAPLMHDISHSLIRTMAELHGLDFQSIGLGDLGRPEGYVERQISGWTRRIEKAKTTAIPSIDFVAKWLSTHQPTSTSASLIHNDFKYDNLVLDPEDWTQVSAVLDWEMATLGDPMMDLGTTLGYWINHDDPEWMQQLALNPTTLPGNPKRSDVAEMYAEASGRDISNIVFYYVYGLFKIAGISQQIYYRYHHGYTHDPRFAVLDKVVAGLGQIATKAIQTERID